MSVALATGNPDAVSAPHSAPQPVGSCSGGSGQRTGAPAASLSGSVDAVSSSDAVAVYFVVLDDDVTALAVGADGDV